jgi:hypothetical protein
LLREARPRRCNRDDAHDRSIELERGIGDRTPGRTAGERPKHCGDRGCLDVGFHHCTPSEVDAS